MLLLATTSSVIRLITGAAALVDVHASWVDRSGTTDTPGATNTAISSATTTTVIAAPASSTARNVRRLNVHNRSTATSVTVTTQVYDGSTAYTLDSRVLGPGQTLVFDDVAGFYAPPTGGPQTRPWYGVVAGCHGDGNPGRLLEWCQTGSTIAATPTNITTSVARCSSFMLPFDLTFNRIRAYGVGITTGVYQVAVYRMSDLAQMCPQQTFSTTAATWTSIGSALGVTLSKDVLYFVAVSVNATGTVAGCVCMGTTVGATTGEIATTPASLPGSLAQGATNYVGGNLFQFACTLGALPTTAPTLVAQASWTGGVPAIWLDSADV